jgi:hypothetical protein
LVPALVAALTLGIAGSAHASNAAVSNGVLTINALAGETNIMFVERTADEGGKQVIVVRDSDGAEQPDDLPANISPGQQIPMFPLGAGCVPQGANALKCTSDNATFTKVVANLNDKNDYFSFDANTLALPDMAINGEAGDDFLKGANGNDTINGGVGNDEGFGFGGNDIIQPGTGSNTSRGGRNDVPISTPETGTDTVDYSVLDDGTTANTAAVYVALDNSATSGTGCVRTPGSAVPAGCAKDTIRNDIENVSTGTGADVVVDSPSLVNGIPVNNVIETSGGDDLIVGDGGTDRVFSGAGDDDITTGNDGG